MRAICCHNSPGGDVFAGLAIYNALVNHNGNQSLARRLRRLRQTRLSCRQAHDHDSHRPSVYAAGTVDDMEKAKKTFLRNEEGTAIYAKRTAER